MRKEKQLHIGDDGLNRKDGESESRLKAEFNHKNAEKTIKYINGNCRD